MKGNQLCVTGEKGLNGDVVIHHFKSLWEEEKDKTKEVPITIGFGNMEMLMTLTETISVKW